jgi:hypothetical protein
MALCSHEHSTTEDDEHSMENVMCVSAISKSDGHLKPEVGRMFCCAARHGITGSLDHWARHLQQLLQQGDGLMGQGQAGHV